MNGAAVGGRRGNATYEQRQFTQDRRHRLRLRRLGVRLCADAEQAVLGDRPNRRRPRQGRRRSHGHQPRHPLCGQHEDLCRHLR